MTPKPLTARVEEGYHDAISRMELEHCCYLPVVEDGRPVGMAYLRHLLADEVRGQEAELKRPNECWEYLPPDSGFGGYGPRTGANARGSEAIARIGSLLLGLSAAGAEAVATDGLTFISSAPTPPTSRGGRRPSRGRARAWRAGRGAGLPFSTTI